MDVDAVINGSVFHPEIRPNMDDQYAPSSEKGLNLSQRELERIKANLSQEDLELIKAFVKRMKEEKEEVEVEVTCTICFEYMDPKGALLPCGHSRFCFECSFKLLDGAHEDQEGSQWPRCPICRRQIVGVFLISGPH